MIYTKEEHVLINKETGEEKCTFNKGSRIYTRTEKQDKAWKEVKEKAQCDKLFKDYQTEKLGGFVFMIYNNIDLLSNQLEIPIQDIPKLVYLSSFLNYNNIISNGKNPMTKKEIQEKIGLAKPAFNKLFKLLKEKNILIEIEPKKVYKFNEDILRKGPTDTDNMKTKMYINTIRYLYENTSTRMHKNLAFAYQLIPFVHKDTNMICKNPFEPIHDLIEPLTLKEICESIGYNLDGKNAKNITKIKKMLTSLSLEDGSPVLTWIESSNFTKERWVLNPNIISNFISSEQYNKFYMANKWIFTKLSDN